MMDSLDEGQHLGTSAGVCNWTRQSRAAAAERGYRRLIAQKFDGSKHRSYPGRGQPQRGLCHFIATTASMRSFFGPFGPGRCLRSGENNKRLSFPQQIVETEQSGRLQNDGGTENAYWAYEKSAQTGEDTIRGMQVGRPLSTTIEDQQLVPNQHGFGDNGAQTARLCQSGQSGDHMNE